MKNKTCLLLFIIATGVTKALKCTKPRMPAIVAADNNKLVIKGYINTGTDSTAIHLSRKTQIDLGVTLTHALNAKVSIQDNFNGSYILTSHATGVYISTLLILDHAKMYKLNITTSDRQVYSTDYNAYNSEIDPTKNISALIQLPNSSAPFKSFFVKTGLRNGYFFSDADCADFSTQGKNTPPAFWIAGAI